MARTTVFVLGLAAGFILASVVMGMQQSAQLGTLTRQVGEVHEDQVNLTRSISDLMYSRGQLVDPVIVDPSLAMNGYPDQPKVKLTDGDTDAGHR